jgi:hypothetical protein
MKPLRTLFYVFSFLQRRMRVYQDRTLNPVCFHFLSPPLGIKHLITPWSVKTVGRVGLWDSPPSRPPFIYLDVCSLETSLKNNKTNEVFNNGTSLPFVSQLMFPPGVKPETPGYQKTVGRVGMPLAPPSRPLFIFPGVCLFETSVNIGFYKQKKRGGRKGGDQKLKVQIISIIRSVGQKSGNTRPTAFYQHRNFHILIELISL